MHTPYGLIDQSAALAAKAALMSQYLSDLAKLNPLRNVAYDQDISFAKREPIILHLNSLAAQVRAPFKAAMMALDVPLERQIENLESVCAHDKRDVLQSIPIITVPVGASYLGVIEAELHGLKHNCEGMFGARFMGRQCYSMDEMHLIAKNPTWMNQYTWANPQDEAELPKLAVLDHLTFVNLAIAQAYTNLTYVELSRLITTRRGLYRLADLEQIRLDRATEVHAMPAAKFMLNRPQLSVLEVM